MEKVKLMEILAKAKVSAERATLYADAFLEYTAAQKNIDDNGAIVADPRTGSPIPNPYLQVRDKAFARLETLHKAGVRAPGLWL
ncbi:MAG: P27 family phage terminase small subunit [Pseudomonadota bacterium]|jgi:hypothetical protein